MMHGSFSAEHSKQRQGIHSRSVSGPRLTIGALNSVLPSTSQSRLLPISQSPPNAVVNVLGHTLIAPNSTLARAIVMGNQESVHGKNLDESRRNIDNNAINAHQRASNQCHHSTTTSMTPHTAASGQHDPHSRGGNKPISNLPALMNQQNYKDNSDSTWVPTKQVSEADSASGPAPLPPQNSNTMPPLGSSAPNYYFQPTASDHYRNAATPPTQLTQHFQSTNAAIQLTTNKEVRRCLSSKELGTLAPPSGSPYAALLTRKKEIEVATRNKLHELRKAEANMQWRRETSNMENTAVPAVDSYEPSVSESSRSQQRECANELRNRRRAEHAKAVVDDLCNVVADLFIAESKLLDPRNYGVPTNIISPSNAISTTSESKDFDRAQILPTIHAFVSSLPLRYALGADTPSEVLLHMRLMAAARSDKTKAALHIHNLDDDNNWTHTLMSIHANDRKNSNVSLRLVTISCHDCTGLLEYISRLLASSGSRVLDADVMLSTDGIVLDRFVVQMTGRLRLARMVNLIENFLREGLVNADKKALKEDGSPISERNKVSSPRMLNVVPEAGPLYFKASDSILSRQSVEEELLQAIPLSDILTSSSDGNRDRISFPKLRKMHSMPSVPPSTLSTHSIPSVRLPARVNTSTDIPFEVYTINDATPEPPVSLRERRPLVNRRGTSDLDRDSAGSVDDFNNLDYLTVHVPSAVVLPGAATETRVVPLIPFDELMLIESIGTGRVSTIYRAAWRRNKSPNNLLTSGAVQMVALKVAMVNPSTGDTSHIDELRREADIAARLQHPNICDLVGVAADPECFCLAYEFCEGGSLLSLLSNHSRYYEYLPIALDIAQGMAFLHKKSIIHRDLKPSNILLTRDHRAKISDFGMSINNHGQELTAETGTYRYMAPEVIRHESYSSNADVYSFGICLWQLITREIPFSTMTPIQAAYAVAEGHRPEIPSSTPLRLQEIIRSCWDHDSQRRPSFTYVAMALADYAKMAFSPANVGTLTLQIANEIVATVEGNSTVNVDFSTPVAGPQSTTDLVGSDVSLPPPPPSANYFNLSYSINDSNGNLGLEIE